MSAAAASLPRPCPRRARPSPALHPSAGRSTSRARVRSVSKGRVGASTTTTKHHQFRKMVTVWSRWQRNSTTFTAFLSCSLPPSRRRRTAASWKNTSLLAVLHPIWLTAEASMVRTRARCAWHGLGQQTSDSFAPHGRQRRGCVCCGIEVSGGCRFIAARCGPLFLSKQLVLVPHTRPHSPHSFIFVTIHCFCDNPLLACAYCRRCAAIVVKISSSPPSISRRSTR